MAVFRKIANLFRRSRVDREIREELEAHIAMRAEENVARGMTPQEARRDARVRFGNPTATREQVLASDAALVVERVVWDFRYAFRQLFKNPAFAITAIVVLALGMGASVAMFAFVNAALLEPLPYQRPNMLMSVNESTRESPLWPLSYADFLDWQRLNKSFTGLAAYTGAGYLLRTPSGAEPVQGERVSEEFFKTLGVGPILGRDFYAGEDRPGGPDVVLLSYIAWLHRFGGRADAVGQTVELDGRSYSIIGVLPQSFSFAPSDGAEFWTPINHLSFHEQSRTFYDFMGVGRLRDGVSAQAAQAEMSAVEAGLQRQYGIVDRNLSARVVPLSQQVVGEVRPILLMLLGGAALLLLIATANVTSLVLARSERRKREIAVRAALGATSGRLSAQFAIESVLLAGIGCGASIAVTVLLIWGMAALVPKNMAAGMPFLENAGLNPHTWLFAACIALLIALLLAAMPMQRLAFQAIRDGLTEADRCASGRSWDRLGPKLVVIELAVAVVLLAGAGLLGKSLYRLLHVPLGFEEGHLATLQVSAPPRSDPQVATLYRSLPQSLSGVPGVKSVGLTTRIPVQRDSPIDRISIVGRPYHGEHNDVVERHVSPDYLPTLRAGLVRGRYFTDADDDSRPGVAMINESFARKYFPGEDPISQKIANDEGGHPSQWQIVGVVGDLHEGSLDQAIEPAEYFPLAQTHDGFFMMVVRTSQDPAAVLPALVSAIHHVDSGLGASDEATMSARIDHTESALMHKLAAWLAGGFAAVALLLGAIGLYGVIAYSVSQRTREIGVRMALGAPRGTVYRMILRQAGGLTLLGIAAGLAGAVGAAMLMRKLLFGVAAWDPWTLAAVAALMATAAVLACYFPARRAASVNPVEALRAE